MNLHLPSFPSRFFSDQKRTDDSLPPPVLVRQRRNSRTWRSGDQRRGECTEEIHRSQSHYYEVHQLRKDHISQSIHLKLINPTIIHAACIQNSLLPSIWPLQKATTTVECRYAGLRFAKRHIGGRSAPGWQGHLHHQQLRRVAASTRVGVRSAVPRRLGLRRAVFFGTLK